MIHTTILTAHIKSVAIAIAETISKDEKAESIFTPCHLKTIEQNNAKKSVIKFEYATLSKSTKLL